MYGLNVASSDTDYVAIMAQSSVEYMCNLKCKPVSPLLLLEKSISQSFPFLFQPRLPIISQDLIKESFDNQGKSLAVEHKVYEAKLFCEMLIKGNPNIMEMLFCGQYAYVTMPLLGQPD